MEHRGDVAVPAQRHSQANLRAAMRLIAAVLSAALPGFVIPVVAAAPTLAQTAPPDDTPGLGVMEIVLGGLEGAWVRNDQLSEDPVHDVERRLQDLDLLPSGLQQFAGGLSRRRQSLVIESGGQAVLLQNALGEQYGTPVDAVARVDAVGNATRAFLVEDSLEIVTMGPGDAWLWVETFHRLDHRLVHQTRSQNLFFPDFHFDTVYDRADGALPVDSEITEHTDFEHPASVRIVPPRRGYRELLAGPVEVRTLVLDPFVRTVEFFLDGESVKRATREPFKARIRLHDPPREQLLEVRAYGNRARRYGSDRIVLNRLDSPFEVRIAEVRPHDAGEDSAFRVSANVSLPRAAALESVEFYRSRQLVAAFDDRDWGRERQGTDTVHVNALVKGVEPDDFVRVVARLTGGREQEDAELLQEAEYSSEIDVQLVQLQVLAVDRGGEPVSDLHPGDFEIRENGEKRPVENLHVSNDVPLVLGIAIDSSVSMGLVWQRLHTVVRRFMAGALDADDRAFLVDFDDTIRLLQPVTGNKPLLAARLNRLLVHGGTALNDGLLFSLLQFRSEPGRRALVVVTDGNDEDSRFTAAEVRDFAESMGVPIYFIGVGRRAPPPILVRKLTRRTGGRLFRIQPDLPPSDLAAEMEQVFDRIDTDLRHQHVLTYYSNLAPGEGTEPDVRSTRRGVTLKSVLPLYGPE